MIDRKLTHLDVRLTEEEFKEIWIQVEYRHIGGPCPAHAYFKESAFANFRRYDVPEAARAILERKYEDTFADRSAVQQSPTAGTCAEGVTA